MRTRCSPRTDSRPPRRSAPTAETLFDVAAKAGRRAVAAFGDQKLVSVCGAGAAAAHWPPDGVLPEGAERGRLGYGADRAVVEALGGLAPAEAELLVVQLDETDSARHLDGPDSPETRQQLRRTTPRSARYSIPFAPNGRRRSSSRSATTTNEPVEPGAIDLAARAAEAGLDVRIHHDGTAALAVGAVGPERLLSLPDVAGCQPLGRDHTLLWGAPGVQFGIDFGLRGHHGSPRTQSQMAIVGGGHPEVRASRSVCASGSRALPTGPIGCATPSASPARCVTRLR